MKIMMLNIAQKKSLRKNNIIVLKILKNTMIMNKRLLILSQKIVSDSQVQILTTQIYKIIEFNYFTFFISNIYKDLFIMNILN